MITWTISHLLFHLHPGRILIGAGFAGFWYHLGMFQQQEYETQGIVDLENNNYYCYSSGCLSLVLAYLNTTVDDVFQTCHGIQHGWRNGTLSRYEMVNVFLDQLVTGRDFDRLQEFLPRLHILVTSSNHGAEIGVARTREELVNLLVQTTWIPFVTGQGWLEEPETVRRNHGMTDRQCSSRSSRNKYLDGGFSRVLHPSCQHAVHVPLNWNTIVHTLNPSFGRETAFHLWDIGRSAAATTSSADYN